MKPKTSKAIKKVASAAATALVQRTNPYGFIPLLLPIIAAAGVGGAMLLSKSSETSGKPSTAGSFFSIPTVIGGAAGYAVGAATKADDKTRIAYAVLGLGAGWAIQRYLIAPNEMAAEAAVAKAEYEANYSWYKPWTW
jgi:hypothetical protein